MSSSERERGARRVSDLPVRMDRPLPTPAVALARLSLQPQTAATLRRFARHGETAGPWTVRRYLGIPHFGAQALGDLLAALEAEAAARGRGEPPRAGTPVAAVERAIELLRVRLPISAEQASAALARPGGRARRVDLAELAHAAARGDGEPPFRVIDLAGTRIAVAPHQARAARTAYAIASRAVYNWGAATVRGVTEQLSVTLSIVFGLQFVERALVAISSFQWLDSGNGWFWFRERPSRLLDDLHKLFSVVPRITVARLGQVLRRTRRSLEPPPGVLGKICASIPGARLAGDLVVVERPPAAPPLKPVESWLVQVFRRVGGPLPAAELLGLGAAAGFSPVGLRRLLRTSLLVDPLPGGTFALVGT